MAKLVPSVPPAVTMPDPQPTAATRPKVLPASTSHHVQSRISVIEALRPPFAFALGSAVIVADQRRQVGGSLTPTGPYRVFDGAEDQRLLSVSRGLEAEFIHRPLDGAAGHLDDLATALHPHLPCAVDGVGGRAGALTQIDLRLSDPVVERLSTISPEHACDGIDCRAIGEVCMADLGGDPRNGVFGDTAVVQTTVYLHCWSFSGQLSHTLL